MSDPISSSTTRVATPLRADPRGERRRTYAGLWVPLVTPFRRVTGDVDLAAAQRLARQAADAGCRGLVVCGTTGEAATVREEDQRRLLDAVVAAVPSSVLVAIGLSGSDTEEVAARARRWSDTPARAMLVSPPAYTKPSTAGVIAHVERVLSMSALPVIIYHVPHRTGVTLDIDALRRLAGHPRIVAVKESAGEHIDGLFDLIHRTDLAVLSGEDKLLLTAACLGADGAIAAAANVRPDLFVRLWTAASAGKLVEARRRFAALMPLIRVLYAEPNPTVIKSALARLGLIDDGVRLPLLAASDQARDELSPVLDAVCRLN